MTSRRDKLEQKLDSGSLTLDEYRELMGLGEVSDPIVVSTGDDLTKIKKDVEQMSSPEDVFANQIKNEFFVPTPLRQATFHDKRQWRADFLWKQPRVIVEIDGGIWLQTETGRSKGHAHPERFIADIEKLNAATLLGYRILRFTPQMVSDGTAVKTTVRLFTALQGET